MKPLPILLATSLVLVLSGPSTAADPAWWSARGVTNSSPESNLSPATTGQAKNMVSQALAELQPRLDTTTYQALQADIAAIVNLTPPVTDADKEKQREVLLVGQLKALSAPFYLTLHNLYPAWIETRLAENQTKDASNSSNFYPWTSSVADDQNLAVATVGQLKAVFALPFEGLPPSADDTDGDGIPDAWETQYFGNLAQIGMGDPDGDEMSNYLEFLVGRNPVLSDSVADVSSRKLDVFNLNPF